MSDPTPTELRATLITVLAGASETSTARWEAAVGPVEMLPLVLDAHPNWRIEVEARPKDRRLIVEAIGLLQAEHPRVRSEKDPSERSLG